MSLWDCLRQRKRAPIAESIPPVVAAAKEAALDKYLDAITKSQTRAAAELELIREQVELLRRTSGVANR